MTGLVSSGYLDSPDFPILPGWLRAHLDPDVPGKGTVREPWEQTIPQRSQERRGIERPDSPASSGAQPPEGLKTAREGGLEALRRLRLARFKENARRAERGIARLEAMKRNHEPVPQALQAHCDAIADHAVPSIVYIETGPAHQAGSDTSRTILTPPAHRITHESTTKAAEAKSDSSCTAIKSPCPTPDFAVELGGDPSISRCQSPWVERWFEEGPTSRFGEFGARVVSSGIYADPKAPQDRNADVQNQRIDARDRNSGEPIQSKSSGADPRCSRDSSSPSSLGKRPNEAACGNSRGDDNGNGKEVDNGDNDGPSHPQQRRLTGPTEGRRRGEVRVSVPETIPLSEPPSWPAAWQEDLLRMKYGVESKVRGGK